MIIGEPKPHSPVLPDSIGPPDTRLAIIGDDPFQLRHTNPSEIVGLFMHMANLEGMRTQDISDNLVLGKRLNAELPYGLQFAKQRPPDEQRGDYAEEYALPEGLSLIPSKVMPVLNGLLSREIQLAQKVSIADEPFKPFKRPIKVGAGRYDESTIRDFKRAAEVALPKITNLDAFSQIGSYANQLSHESLWATATAVHVAYDVLEACSPEWANMKKHDEVLAYAKSLHDLIQYQTLAHSGNTMNFDESQEFMENMQQFSKVLTHGRAQLLQKNIAMNPTASRMFDAIPEITNNFSWMFDYKVRLNEVFKDFSEQYRQLQKPVSIFGQPLRAAKPADEAVGEAISQVAETVPPEPDVTMPTPEIAGDVGSLTETYLELVHDLAALHSQYSILPKKELKATYGELWKMLSGISATSRKLSVTGIPKEQAAQQIGILFVLNKQLESYSVTAETDAELESSILEQLTELYQRSSGSKHPLPPHERGFIAQNYSAITSNWEEYKYLLTQTGNGFTNHEIKLLDGWFNKAENTEPEPSEALIIDLGRASLSPFSGMLEQVAEQLTWEVLPSGDEAEIKQNISSAYSAEHVDKINWQRIQDLVQLRDTFDGNMYRSKTGSLGMRPPYFIVEMNLGGFTFAVAENALEGNATYLLREDLTAGTWQEVLELDKRTARSVGAERIIHRNESDHLTKILNALQDLFTLQRA